MSRKGRDPHKARLRRDRIRREKHAQRFVTFDQPPPAVEHPFAAERSLWEIQALLEGRKFESIDELNASLADLTRDGRISEIAGAWKRDDPKWRAQSLAYDALETGDIEEALFLVHEALQLDPDCTDAQRLMVSLLPASLENKVHLMREVVEKAETNLGERFFEENTGDFWGTVSTRPYMRAKQHLGELLEDSGEYPEAISIFERLLELNPNDNQGMRYRLLALYLAVDRQGSAGSLLSRYPGEEEILGSLAWARVLERWLSDDQSEAEAALARARKVNPFVEAYVCGIRPIPAEGPAYYRPGEDSGAQVCAVEFGKAWERHPGFREWVVAHR